MMRHPRHGLLAAVALAAGLAAGTAMAQTPIDACTTIIEPGSYVLTRNLTASGDCIVVDADHVTVDLNGFAILGDGTGSGVSRGNSFPEGLTVRNGTIANFDTGLFSSGTRRCQVRNLRVLNNSGNGVSGSNVCITSGNISSGNGSSGFGGINNGFVAGNIARGNNSAAIRPGNFSLVAGNVVEGNRGFFSDGIQPREGSLVTGNAVHNNRGSGIFHLGLGGDPNSLAATNNAVTVNAQGGLELIPINDDDGVLAIYNTFRSNSPAGNQVGTCTNCTIDHNTGIADSP